jgi:HK97 gp10 family phage protein
MAREVELAISGLQELQQALEDLNDKLATKYVREAAREGGKIVRAEMVLMAPKDSGLLSEHIDVKTRAQRGEARAVSAFIGPNAKTVIHPQVKGKTAGLPRTAAFLSRLLEFGSIHQPKHPFLTAAWEASKGRALDAIVRKLKDRLLG